ncbi:hypothetical protein BGZ96_007840 [Linnemannia gamsii]|uniref:Uncharacterized protein n=1 Tax=Linnemannia gamsii TaxID=64522 RepID=A0ABQ7K086_9FUNG|nr:hypothetical protein BGZ96_007840 [Linnemannia gamsii]
MNNSTNGGARRQDRGKARSKASVVVIGEEDDDDDDFDLPGIDELFSDDIPRKIRRVESSEITNKASKYSNPDMVMNEQVTAKAKTAEDDPWLMSDLQVDQDIDLFTPSPTSNHGELLARNVNGPPHKIPSAMSTRSTVSQTQNALNEIDQLFIDGSPTRSPSTRFQTPFEDRELSEQRSPTLYVGATGIYPPDQDMDDYGAGEVVLFEDPQQDEPMGGNSVIVSDAQDVGCPIADDDVKPETQDKPCIDPKEDPSMVAVSEQASETAEQVAGELDPPRVTHTFTLPHSSSAFKERLKQLSSGFHTSMDDMMDAIIDVEHLRTSVEKTLTDRQELLHQRGERIHCQARQLQEEASTLHSKTRDNMLRAIQHE